MNHWNWLYTLLAMLAIAGVFVYYVMSERKRKAELAKAREEAEALRQNLERGQPHFSADALHDFVDSFFPQYHHALADEQLEGIRVHLTLDLASKVQNNIDRLISANKKRIVKDLKIVSLETETVVDVEGEEGDQIHLLVHFQMEEYYIHRETMEPIISYDDEGHPIMPGAMKGYIDRVSLKRRKGSWLVSDISTYFEKDGQEL
jgi:hypothetical protein